MSTTEIINTEANRVLASGELGKSRTYSRLFEYLIQAGLNNRSPKEIEVAIDVFGKDESFDVSKDATVRVYIHKLRKKLADFYAKNPDTRDYRLIIPNGQYRIQLQGSGQETGVVSSPAAPARLRDILISLVVLLLGINVYLLADNRGATQSEAVRPSNTLTHPLWSPFIDDDLPITIILGDYYIFGELDHAGEVSRMIRNFSVNSAADFETLLMQFPEESAHYVDMNLSYLPTGSAFALREIIPLLSATGKPLHISLMSELNINSIKAGHIIYIGYISALQKLEDFVFSASRLAVGDTYDELFDRDTGESYISEAGIAYNETRNYRDYGLISSFPGPAGNRMLVIAGARDTGLMHVAHAMATHQSLTELEQVINSMEPGKTPAFEALYEVTGVNRTSLDGRLVFSSLLDPGQIWSGRQ